MMTSKSKQPNWEQSFKTQFFLFRNGFIAIFCCLIIAGCGNPEKEKLAHVARGREYLKQKRYAEARIEFRSALQIDRKLVAAQLGLGESAYALGHAQEAAEAYY